MMFNNTYLIIAVIIILILLVVYYFGFFGGEDTSEGYNFYSPVNYNPHVLKVDTPERCQSRYNICATLPADDQIACNRYVQQSGCAYYVPGAAPGYDAPWGGLPGPSKPSKAASNGDKRRSAHVAGAGAVQSHDSNTNDNTVENFNDGAMKNYHARTGHTMHNPNDHVSGSQHMKLIKGEGFASESIDPAYYYMNTPVGPKIATADSRMAARRMKMQGGSD